MTPPAPTFLSDLPAPAKLNLFLHLTGRRADGYHLLQSVFMLVDWCDRLSFERRSDGLVRRYDLHPPAHGAEALPADDLCVRAARALQAATGCTLGADIHLDKQLPAQAGMGGGSSDAATCLLALRRLWALDIDNAALARIGLSLGADVPFFLGGTHAWVEGVGEQLRPIELPPARFVIVKPDAGLETKRIFTDPQLKRDSEAAILSGFVAKPFGFGRNDLQPVAERLCPDVSQAIQWLTRKGLAARMTGSGSAVFAQLTRDVDLTDAPGDMTVHTCANLPRHPLADW